jgi:hypothetical protein
LKKEWKREAKMIDRVSQEKTGPLESRTIEELQAIASALRCRIVADDHYRRALFGELAKVQELIESRGSAAGASARRGATR